MALLSKTFIFNTVFDTKKDKFTLYVLTNYYKIYKISMTGSGSDNFFCLKFIFKFITLV